MLSKIRHYVDIKTLKSIYQSHLSYTLQILRHQLKGYIFQDPQQDYRGSGPAMSSMALAIA